MARIPAPPSTSAPSAESGAGRPRRRPADRRAAPLLRAAAFIAVALLGACGVDRDPARTAVVERLGTSVPEHEGRGERIDLEADVEAAARSVIARGHRELSLLFTIDQAPRRILASGMSGRPSVDALQPPLADDLAADLVRSQRESLARSRISLPPGDEPDVRIQALHRHPGKPVVAVVCLTIDRVDVRAADGRRSSTAAVAQQVLRLRPSTPAERSGPGWTVIDLEVTWTSGAPGRTCPGAPSEEELCGCHDEGTPPEDQGPAAAAARWSASSATETRALRPLVEGSR